ncbi:hypothetical protein niasHT_025382 [Heterodera trifolii]|uniref:Uncharacterized protein n=1 Tax=Heterodera trifolii TaxID=157864 RepID=A0ABD2JJ19_9BILA
MFPLKIAFLLVLICTPNFGENSSTESSKKSRKERGIISIPLAIGAVTAFLTPIIIGATVAGYYIGTKSAIDSNDRSKLAEIFFHVKLSLHDEQLSIDIEHFSNAYIFQEIQRITKKPNLDSICLHGTNKCS